MGKSEGKDARISQTEALTVFYNSIKNNNNKKHMDQEAPPVGVKIVQFLACVMIAVLMWPFVPANLSSAGYHTLVVFIALILSFLVRPMPMGLLVLCAILALAFTHEISFKEGLAGYAHTTVWLVIAAFMIAQSIEDTGLGRRISLLLLKKFSKSTTSIAYAICLSELVLAPVVASNTARGGGVLSPIVNAITKSLGLSPNHDKDSIGQFIFLTAAHANLITSAMFLTGMAANPLTAGLAKDYLGVDFNWSTWAYGAIVPGLCSLFLLPLYLKFWLKPKNISNQQVKDVAAAELKKLGQLKRNEKILSFVFISLILLWSLSFLHHYSTSLVAWLGVAVLGVSGVLEWESIIANRRAWDTMIWLGGLLALATALKKYGAIAWLVNFVSLEMLSGYPVILSLIILALIYFYSMYGFSMLTAHIAAFISAFFVLCYKLEAPPLLVTAIFAYFSNLCGCLTHYSTGPLIIYFSFNFVQIPRWFGIGLLISFYHIALWLGLGLAWWRLIGFWG